MEYRLPTLNDEQALKEYVKEHYAIGEKSIHASMGLTSMDFSEWINQINTASETGDVKWGKYYLYLVLEDNKIIGLLNIRYELDQELANEYGHIGYGVRPSERRKGYATKLLDYSIKTCKDKGLNELILGCYDENIGSKIIIERSGAKLYKTVKDSKSLDNGWDLDLQANYYKLDI